jgi:hypothetical protein
MVQLNLWALDHTPCSNADAWQAFIHHTCREVIDLYVQALRAVWLVMAGVSCLGFCRVFIEKHVELRKDHTTEFGLAGSEHQTTLDVEEGPDLSTEERKGSVDFE